MLSTDSRTTRTLDPCTGAARAATAVCARHDAVTVPSYRIRATRPIVTAATAGITTFGSVWSFDGRKPMPKVDLHPDRWPLHSTS